MSKLARIRLNWVPSISTDVESQTLGIHINGDFLEYNLPPGADSFEFVAAEKAEVTVDVTASDGAYVSPPATVTFNVGDLSEPAAPTGLQFTIVEVIEAEENA